MTVLRVWLIAFWRGLDGVVVFGSIEGKGEAGAEMR